MKYFLLLSVICSQIFGQSIDWNNSQLNFKNTEEFTFSKKYQHVSNALVIVRNGKLVFEKYSPTFNKNSSHRIWSISKSITHTITYLAIEDGIIKLDSLVSDFYPQLKKSEFGKKLTIKHLLQMSSGIEWSEGYESNPLDSNVIQMLYIFQYKDMANYTANLNFHKEPGTYFNYSSGDTNLLMGVLKKAIGKKYDAYPWEKLFEPLEMKDVTWQQDQSGTFVGSSYLFMRARDLIKIGFLYLNDGKINGRQIISTEHALSASTLTESSNGSYGQLWWLNKDLPKKDTTRTFPDLPEDAYFGLGHHGQTLLIIPSKKLVALRYGIDKKYPFDRNQWGKNLLKDLQLNEIKE